jgi:RNA polymerase sigma factor (sigma-70 family)
MTPLFVHRQSGERAFERLYRTHVQDVYRYALMVLRNRADAEDVAQTTFLKAYRALQRGDRPRHPRKWLITIAHNTCRTRMRDAKRRPQEVSFDTQIADTAAIRTNEDVDVRELVHALGSLSFNQRSALVMRELEGRSYAEIAELLDLSSSAVETLLFRARRAIREQLEGPLTCGEAERALSLQLDGRLPTDERGRLRAHLRECGECATLARRQRARRAALRSLGPLPLPASLTSWGGGAAVGTGVAAKAAAVVAAGVVAAGAGHEVADAVDRPAAVVPREAVVVARPPAPSVAEKIVASHAKSAGASRPKFEKGSKIGRPTTLEHVAPEADGPAAPAAPAAAAPAAATTAPTATVAQAPTQTVTTVVEAVQNTLPVETPPLPPVQPPQPPPVPPLPVQPPPLPEVPKLPLLP